MVADSDTKPWIRNRSDELAVAAGCRFDPARADKVLRFFREILVLYEGDKAGQNFELIPWQVDVLSRVFGWVRFDDDWNEWVRRFRVASLWIPKKNGKSPTAAGVGVFLLTVDGEEGQKVFTAAKDGQQAGIVQKHAMEMVRRSPLLSSECTINRTKKMIVHEPTASQYGVIAGDNIRGQEGLNGSVIIDETHVVDMRLGETLKYMGATRKQPLQFEVSTAGNDLQGYGRQQWEYGRDVAAGKFNNTEFFWESFHAPQDATDEELGNEDVWKAANPSWGFTIKPREFRAKYDEAKRSLSSFSTWKMYRLNVWQHASNPWLKQDDWKRCHYDFTLEDFRGRDVWVGLDLGLTRDMTAAVLMFRSDDEEDGVIYQWPLFWMPTDEAREKDYRAPYLQWARDGWLTLTPGNVCDYGRVRDDLCGIVGEYGLTVRLLAADPRFAEETTQILSEEWGCDRENISQSRAGMAEPTAVYERLVIGGKLRHAGHPILDWQAGHVQVDERQGLRKPVKPDSKDHKKIDGISAGLNVVTQAAQAELYDYDGPVYS